MANLMFSMVAMVQTKFVGGHGCARGGGGRRRAAGIFRSAGAADGYRSWHDGAGCALLGSRPAGGGQPHCLIVADAGRTGGVRADDIRHAVFASDRRSIWFGRARRTIGVAQYILARGIHHRLCHRHHSCPARCALPATPGRRCCSVWRSIWSIFRLLYAFILGNFGAPRMGAAGAPFASGLSFFCAVQCW